MRMICSRVALALAGVLYGLWERTGWDWAWSLENRALNLSEDLERRVRWAS